MIDDSESMSMTVTASKRTVEDCMFWLLDQLRERGFDRAALSMSVISVLCADEPEYEVQISGRVFPQGSLPAGERFD